MMSTGSDGTTSQPARTSRQRGYSVAASLSNFFGGASTGSSWDNARRNPEERSVYGSTNNTSARPAFGRSVSSVLVNPRERAGSYSRLPDIAPTSFRRTYVDRPETPEWSVFGELYQREDLSRAPRPSTRMHNRHGMHDAQGRPRPHSHHPQDAKSGIEPGTDSIVQSPVQSPFLVGASTDVSDNDDSSSTYSASTEDNNSSEEDDQVPAEERIQPRRWYSFSDIPSLPPLYRNILKCSVAYFIASLFTFSPYLSGFIADITTYGSGATGPSPSGHMVATVAVYYNPAKTLGGMVQADLFCTMGLLFAAFVSLSSMSMYWFFEVQPGWEWLADSLVLLWIGLGMSLVAWTKVWMAKPTFNTACSMTAIILFVVVVREGGLQTLLQVSFIVLCGATISNLVCSLLWPQRATKNLQDAMTRTLQSFSTLMEMLTATFLLTEPRHHLRGETLQRAAQSHQASFTSLKKHFDEAQSEWMFGGPSKSRSSKPEEIRRSSGQAYEDAIDSLNRLGQHLNGLRSGTTLQTELIRAERDGKLVLERRSAKSRRRSYAPKPLSAKNTEDGQAEEDDEETAILNAAAAMFGDLIEDLGPPLKALSTTCTTTLKRLRDAFVQPQRSGVDNPIHPSEFQQLADNVQRALYTFESTSNHAVLRLYRSQNASGTQSRDSIHSAMEENHLLTGNDGENVFLVYFFIFTLQEFAQELISLIDALERVYSAEHAAGNREHLWKRLSCVVVGSVTRRSSRANPSGGGLRKRLSAYFAPEIPRHKAASFPKITPHAPNTVQTPARANLTRIGRFKQTLWAIGARLNEPDIKYAIKAGMATAMLAAPAFFDATRPLFLHYRGEWALISFFVVISPTIGATNFLGVHRVLGTLLGAATAAAIWTAFPENPYALSIFGLFFSIPCFYYIVATPQYATSSRFVLLTYNLTCLYCYNRRQKDIAVTDIAFHRAVAVTVGVVWAAIVSRYWWPTEARRALGKALSEFCLNTGWLYTRLVAFNSFADDDRYSEQGEDSQRDPPATETTALLRNSTHSDLTRSIHDFMAMELHLQIKLIELQGLLAQTQHEPRLKGPFPVALYRSILTSLQTILDKLHSMRCVTSREEWHTTVHRDFILPVNRERREMVGNIILYFSTLASAFRLKAPLPPYLPPAEEARLRLVDAIRKLDVVRNRDVRGSRQLLFFAYAITMKGVVHELDFLGRTLQEAFGVIGQSREEFESLFEDPTVMDIAQSV
ncbi:hypothetical protein WOLCODRAFT_140156 [Wolfiporia cocos MD-104 SS10]|uniref:Uncharacterized protein n=1 Tax=Wolfiporia cocos (strain MD-104) TaxID=742152 RepID=A0A2H3J1C7_WOLCO|nr:hypothetical protein WOLCODRAFT_140156 [Wolfiporia cocos MD-104 SS10]